MLVYLNGKLVDKEKATISVFDHGLFSGMVCLKASVATTGLFLN